MHAVWRRAVPQCAARERTPSGPAGPGNPAGDCKPSLARTQAPEARLSVSAQSLCCECCLSRTACKQRAQHLRTLAHTCARLRTLPGSPADQLTA